MTIHSISGTSLAIYLSDEEVRAHRLEPAAVTAADTAEIVKLALRQVGICKFENTYTEIFPGRSDLLLFVRLASGSRIFFSFESFEHLIAAASCCSSAPPSSLTYMNGRYILALYPWEGGLEYEAFREFGEELFFPPAYTLHLAEHGKTLIPSDAVETLREHFLCGDGSCAKNC